MYNCQAFNALTMHLRLHQVKPHQLPKTVPSAFFDRQPVVWHPPTNLHTSLTDDAAKANTSVAIAVASGQFNWAEAQHSHSFARTVIEQLSAS